MTDTPRASLTVYPDQAAAIKAVRLIAHEGTDIRTFSVVGKVDPFDRIDRTCFWESCASLWIGLHGQVLTGVMVTTLEFGALMIGGHMADVIVTMDDRSLVGAPVKEGLGRLGRALANSGINNDGLILCQEMLRTDGFLVIDQATGIDAVVPESLSQLAHTGQLAGHASDPTRTLVRA